MEIEKHYKIYSLLFISFIWMSLGDKHNFGIRSIITIDWNSKLLIEINDFQRQEHVAVFKKAVYHI